MKCLVTGAAGFVGANLVRTLLGLNHDVSIIVRKDSNDWRFAEIKNRLHICYGDLTARSRVFEIISGIRPDIVFHLAAYGGFPHQLDRNTMLSANLAATTNLLDAAVACDLPQFIHTGSSSEYGIKNNPMREDDVCEPVTYYGITKLAATNYCAMIGKTLHYRVCTLRLFSPFGPLEDASRLYPTITSALSKGERPRLSRPDSVRDFIAVEKVCDSYIKIASAQYTPGAIINVGSGRQQTIREFYYKIAGSMGLSLEPDWNQVPPKQTEPLMWEADMSKLKSLIDFSTEQEDESCR